MTRIESLVIDQISVANLAGEPTIINVIQCFIFHNGAKIPGRCWMETPEGHAVTKSGPYEFTIQCTGEVCKSRLHTAQIYNDTQIDSLFAPAIAYPPDVLPHFTTTQTVPALLPGRLPGSDSGRDDKTMIDSLGFATSQ